MMHMKLKLVCHQKFPNKSKLTGTSNTASMSDTGTKVNSPPPTFHPEDLKEHTSLMDEKKVGQEFRGRINNSMAEDSLEMSVKKTKMEKLPQNTRC
jgi:hypothetical protein